MFIRSRFNHRKLLAAGVAATLAFSTLTGPAASTANAQSSVEDLPQPTSSQPDSGLTWDDPFYQPPENLPAAGELIRTQAAPQLLNVLGPDFGGYAEKILYSSTTVHGDPVAVSGFTINPANKWQGNGPTPTVVFAPGTRGSGDACAPSKGPMLLGQYDTANQAFGMNYELPFAQAAAAMGMRVVFTDYIGLGTPGQHTYVLHDEEANAVLDAARAAVPDGAPVGLFGYSQGGGATAAAAEKQAEYAPELNIKGVYSGAAPADLIEVMQSADNSLITPVLAFAYHGYGERFPEFKDPFDSLVNDRGRAFLADNKNACIGDSAVKWAMADTSDMTSTGDSLLAAVMADENVYNILDSQKLGRTAPMAPIFVATGGNDDLVPSPQTEQMARDYCSLNADVTFLDEHIQEITPGVRAGLNHAGSYLTQTGPAFSWLVDRFNGKATKPNCGGF